MATHNPLLTYPLTQTAPGPSLRSGGGSVSSGYEANIGPVHLTIIGLVVAAVLGLILLRKAGFSFSVKVGGR